jgi:membrane protein DedA with SNARE-associated domain
VQPDLPDVLVPLGSVLDRYGYLAVVGMIMVESFGIPAPGQTMLIVAGACAATGRLDLAAVIALAVLAAIAGDCLAYLLGRTGGRPLVLRLGRYVWLTEKRLVRVEDLFRRHGRKIVVVARFVDGLRQVNGVVAGVVRMPFGRFLGWDALAAALWAAVFSGVGYLGGVHLDALFGFARAHRVPLLLGLAVLVGALVVRRVARRRARRAPVPSVA